MIDSTNQSVVNDPNPSAKAPAAGSDAQDDDFGALLSEYDRGVKQQPAPATPTPAPAADTSTPTPGTPEARLAALEAEARTRAEQDYLVETKTAIDGATATIKEVIGDTLPVKVTEKMIRGYLAETAQEDPRFMAAFENRGADPQKWARIVSALGRQLAKELGSAPDQAATQARAAVNAAVRASVTTAADAPEKDWSRMSHAEFQAERQKAMRGG